MKLLAPNGKPSNLNEQQWHLVRTPEFKRWFGDWENHSENASKVVDENFEPLVVYHGTQASFNKFKKQNTYFTDSKKYIKSLIGKDAEVKEVFINSKKVCDLTMLGFREISFAKFTNECVKQGAKKNYADYEELEDYVGNDKYMAWQFFRSDEPYLSIMATNWLEYFFDVIIYKNSGLENSKSKTLLFISSRKNKLPNQIKLADGSNTTFDGNNTDIRYDDGGEVKSNSFMKWYIDWYKGISDKMFIAISLPTIVTPFKEKNVVILDVFEKIDQNIDAKSYLNEIIEKADKYEVTIYLEPTPRYKYFQDNLEKKKKITKEYLIKYYEIFGFELTPNKQFMKRLPIKKYANRENINFTYEIGGL